MFPDYDTPGNEHSAAPASFAAARASESGTHAVTEPSAGTGSDASTQEQPQAGDNLAANGSTNTADDKAHDDKAPNDKTLEDTSSASQIPAEMTASTEEASSPSNEDLNRLMDQYATPHQAPTEGEIVQGRVVAIADVGVVVDIGGKTEAL